jgi:hypothetical protein
MKRFFSFFILSLLLLSQLCGCKTNLFTKLRDNDSNQPAESEKPAETAVADEIVTNFTNYKEDFKNDGGEVMLSFCAARANVSISGNSAAADVINSYLTSRYDLFYSETGGYVQSAEEMYKQIKPEETSNWNSYMMARDMAAARSDSDVLSITYSDYYYLGGAHGSTLCFAENYDASTGKLLTLSDLADDGQKLIDFSVSYLVWLAAKPGFSDLFPWADEEALKTVVADSYWFFSDEGLVFICNEYTIGPYAAGMTDLTIPYEDLKGVVSDKWIPARYR